MHRRRCRSASTVTLPLALLLSLFALLAGAPAQAAAQPSSDSTAGPAVEEYLGEWLRVTGAPGGGAGLVDGDETVTRTDGVTSDPGETFTDQTPILLGSVAKTFTSTLVLQLVDEGWLSLDEEAADHLTWLDHPATVEQLLDHTAGYAAADGLAVSERYDEEATVTDSAQRLERSGTPGEYEYSSANYLVLGALVEAVTGQPYAEALRDRITGPLGMERTGVDGAVPGTVTDHRLWWGGTVEYDHGTEPSGAPYGYLVSTVEDLRIYARAHLDGELLPDSLRAQAWSIRAGGDGGDAADQGYGLGWQIDASGDTRHVHHPGATPGAFAHILLLPDEDRAVVVVANAYSEATAESLSAAAGHLDALAQGEEVEPAPRDPLLTAMPWLALVPVALAVLVILGLVVRPPRSRRRAAVWLAATVLVAGALVLAPDLLGMSWGMLAVWAPDVRIALVAGVVVWGCAALLAAVRCARGLRSA